MIDTDSRLDFLKVCQNRDGGWGYFPGKQSWLEPTVYACLALHGDAVTDRAWSLIRSWQLPSGAFRPSATVGDESWVTALALTLACVRNDSGLSGALEWLLRTRGLKNTEAAPWYRRPFVKPTPDVNENLKAWPWRPGAGAWVEPTAHSLVALKKLGKVAADPQKIKDRIGMAEKMLFDRRCSDHGWNYGNRRVLGTDLESYPETTGIALLGLYGSRESDLSPSFNRALNYWRGHVSPLGRAWLAIALRIHGISFDESLRIQGELKHRDVLLTALESLGSVNGNWRLLKAEAI